VRIDYLRNNPFFEPRLAELCGQEWAHLYPDWDRVVALREFASQRADGRLPLSLVAMKGNDLLGMVSLIFDDLPGYEHLNPWLASLFILPEHREKGVGSRLVEEAEALLKRNQLPRAYLFTESAGPFFERLGWSLIAKTVCHDHPIAIFTKNFAKTAVRSQICKASLRPS
jgi:GNAT superfamily N-acetyltransferase